MKFWMKWTLAAALAVALSAPCGFASSEESSSAGEVAKETRELLEALKNYSAEQRDEAVAATKEALDKLDAEIGELEKEAGEKLDKMDQAARKQAEQSLERLRALRDEVAKRYEDLKTGTAEGWAKVKEGFSEALRDLEDVWEKTKAKFDDDDRTSL